jgi:hypothetical protein
MSTITHPIIQQKKEVLAAMVQWHSVRPGQLSATNRNWNRHGNRIAAGFWRQLTKEGHRSGMDSQQSLQGFNQMLAAFLVFRRGNQASIIGFLQLLQFFLKGVGTTVV